MSFEHYAPIALRYWAMANARMLAVVSTQSHHPIPGLENLGKGGSPAHLGSSSRIALSGWEAQPPAIAISSRGIDIGSPSANDNKEPK